MTVSPFGEPWTQQKLDILRRYLDAYTTALKQQPFWLIYVDAFAGEGHWQSKSDYSEFHEMREGSALVALDIDDRPFDHLVFIEQDPKRCISLQRIKEEWPGRNIDVFNQDANKALPALCKGLSAMDRLVVFLDPFATSVQWATVEQLAQTRKADCWILFPLMAVARLMPQGEEPPLLLQNRLDSIFGGREHWASIYSLSPQFDLWGEQSSSRPSGSQQIANLYRDRLKTVFAGVAATRGTLRNSKKAPLFELFFAAGNPKGSSIAIKIADHLLKNL